MVSISEYFKKDTQSNNTELVEAAYRGDLKEVKRLVEKRHADVNAKDKNGETAGMWAAWNGNFEMVKYFVENGMDVNARNNEGETAGMMAAWHGHFEVVEYLVEHGMDVNARNNKGETVGMDAAWNGNLEVVKCLVENGMDVNAKNNDGWTAGMEAALIPAVSPSLFLASTSIPFSTRYFTISR